MAFTIVQSGSSLFALNSGGGASPALSIPSDIDLNANLVPRFAKFNRYIVMVNSVSRPVSIDPLGTVRPLVPNPPGAAVSLSTVAGGSLTGTFLVKQTYFIKDAQGNLIAESDFGPSLTAGLAITTDFLKATFPVSSDAYFLASMPLGSTYGTRLYRTVTNGSVYFKWVDVDGNTHTFVEDDTLDDAISIFAAPSVGSAPDLTLVKEWQGRLWGVDRVHVDDLRYTEAGTMHGWYAQNTISVRPGQDAAGIMAIIPRRSALGVARREVFVQITGTSTSNFQQTVVTGGEGRGCVSQESVVIDNDIAYFLWRDGVYKWDSSGISCISDDKVSAWFRGDDVFNRSMFHRATAQLVDRTYRLFLCPVGSTELEKWIEYDLDTKTWWGPHVSDGITPTSTVLVAGSDNQPYPMVGTQEGYVVQEHDAANDMEAFPIPVRVKTKAHAAGDPEATKYFGELSIWGKKQASGEVDVIREVGTLDGEAVLPTISYDMTKGRQRMQRVGVGRHATLTFEHETINEPVVLYGYTIPVKPIGRR